VVVFAPAVVSDANQPYRTCSRFSTMVSKGRVKLQVFEEPV